MKYEFSGAGPVLLKLLGLSKRWKWRLYDRFERIAAHPTNEPDLRLSGGGGRVLSVVVDGDWLICYWVDEAARRVIIVDLEDAGASP